MMNAKKIIKSYIGPSPLLCVLAWLLAIATLVTLGTGLYQTVKRDDPRDAARFSSLYEDSGDFVYLDAIGVDEWVCKYTVDSKATVYYTVLAADQYYYLVVLSDAQLDRLEAQQEFWYEYDYDKPIPKDTEIYRLYGVARPINAELKADVADVYEMNPQEFDEYFGTYYMDATTLPSDGRGGTWLLTSLVCFALWLIISPVNRRVRRSAKKSIKNLEQSGRLEQAAAELKGSVKVIGRDKCRMSDSFVFTCHEGGAIPYEDILWVYRANLPSNGSLLAAFTGEKTGHTLVKVKGQDMDGLIDSTMELISQRAPSALVGLNTENQQKYTAMMKELKAARKAEKASKSDN